MNMFIQVPPEYCWEGLENTVCLWRIWVFITGGAVGGGAVDWGSII